MYHKVQVWDQNCLYCICNDSTILKFILFADDTNVLGTPTDNNDLAISPIQLAYPLSINT